ncbi:hypothetical protein [Halosegnis sp.]|uniref:hypothetical protein n=1 Tax=Halosegnis sp. TaxID=2864959 RepID=UPI0035D51B4D
MTTLTPEAIYEYTGVTDVALSPDGEREEQRHSSVFVVPTDGSRAPTRLTRASDASSPV